MNIYETVFIISNNLTEKSAAEKISECESIIKKDGGKTLKKEYWGVRTLAYKIKKSFKGHYFLLNFETSYDSISKIENKLKIDEDSLRFMNIRIKKFDKEPSIMYKSLRQET
tara:strand:- start:310 stop:645 length:336 start_codon:yes stop_codon:yes gene_type:complete